MVKLRRRSGDGVLDWWTRVSWGALVIIGPILCYLALLIALDLVGLSADRDAYFQSLYATQSFRADLELELFSIAGRAEYALTAAGYFLVSVFSILWAAPRILAKRGNPFGGVFGLLIALGASAVLYALYWYSDFNLRILFADRVLQEAEARGLLSASPMVMTILGVEVFAMDARPSEMLARLHAVVYMTGNAAPWFLIVFSACCASFERGAFGKEPRRNLRQRMALLQIAIVLGAANIVLSVAYLRAMLNWPTHLMVDETTAHFLIATTRYTAIWGAIGTLMLLTVVAPAYISLNRHFDRVAVYEREREGDDYVSYKERKVWREEHGLNLTSQEILATGAAVLAPLLASPTLEAGGPEPNPPAIEQSVGAGQ